ncbi:dipeptidyl aminopeptidase IV [Hyphomonas johnsonii MHS-2]|uniref:Dipeptidyl aminopeptidase IV n=1 Tax=Hyphomonas johnsonii MHS-2 TaxID=1280950 RepID=A0A059FVC5_9PROT|nr:S9 family peptidase [Hyphomonas johnsonii]KCZ94461.1 dipeptidyl aminopeptidase IV [Hyphomonas johnsonii MHS-2]
MPESRTDLTLERLYASPSLSGPAPRGVKFSPDGRRVTFLKGRPDEQDRFDLWQFLVATGEQALLVDSQLLQPVDEELSEAEKALRERKRIAGSKGIVDYSWGTADTILVPMGGDLFLVTLGAGTPQVRQLTDSDAFETDAKVSPGGRHVSFVRDGALYAIDLTTGEESRLSPAAEPDKAISYGVAEFVAQEEMHRFTGYWWSPDDKYVAYTRVDESTVDIIPRFDIEADKVTVIEQRYPRAGRPNAVVDLFVRDMATGETVEINWRRDDWGPATDQYLARVDMISDSLVVQAVDRDQTFIKAKNVRFSDGQILSGEGVPPTDTSLDAEFLAEYQACWVNLRSDFLIIPDIGLLTTSENGDGSYRHLVLLTGGGVHFFPHGDWPIDELAGAHAPSNTAFVTGYKDTPLERHLYRIGVDRKQFFETLKSGTNADEFMRMGESTRITAPGKTWAITMAPDGQSFVGASSSPGQPPQVGLYKADGSLIAWIEENRLDETHPYAPFLSDHSMPEFGTLKAEDGQDLYYSLLKPPGFDPAKQYPVIVEVYGGPGVQTVVNEWGRVSDQFYAREGYILFRLDNRGSANRGKTFEDVIYRRTGGPEVRDQLVGVDWLKSQPFVDAGRIAIQGWSYGGYMTLMTVLQAPEGTFAAAAAGAPVTDWRLYDTFYTERYMDTPEDNPDGYEASSVFPYVDNLTTPLLLMHGMADDNVTFDNTTRLMAALQEKGKPFELMTYPGQRHGIRGEALQVHLMKTRMAFLDRHLKKRPLTPA